ncbi:MAG: GyrI-like domain-containing protein [Candidatus Methylopumilus sp.]
MKKQLPYFVLFFVLPVVAMLAWWGLFSSASLALETSPAYDYVYLDAEGPYSKLSSKQNEVLFYMKQQNIAHGAAIAIVMTDPRTTSYKALLARAGFLVDHPLEVKAPLKIGHIAPQKVAVAQIKAHPLLAYGKTYSVLLDYCKKQDMKLQLPTVEIFEHSVLRVEMPLQAQTGERS